MLKKPFAIKSLALRLVPVNPASYEVYEAAARYLKQKLGADAPDVVTLINYELSNRDVTGIAEDFLDFFDTGRARLVFELRAQAGSKRPWMHQQVRAAMIVAKLHRGKTATNDSRWGGLKPPTIVRVPASLDPSRN